MGPLRSLIHRVYAQRLPERAATIMHVLFRPVQRCHR